MRSGRSACIRSQPPRTPSRSRSSTSPSARWLLVPAVGGTTSSSGRCSTASSTPSRSLTSSGRCTGCFRHSASRRASRSPPTRQRPRSSSARPGSVGISCSSPHSRATVPTFARGRTAGGSGAGSSTTMRISRRRRGSTSKPATAGSRRRSSPRRRCSGASKAAGPCTGSRAGTAVARISTAARSTDSKSRRLDSDRPGPRVVRLPPHLRPRAARVRRVVEARRHRADQLSATIASPISLAPMIRQITAMIVAFSRAIQSCRSARIFVALSPIR
jgi:hypothetical protein